MTDLIRIHEVPHKIYLEIAYATSNNFMKRPVYSKPHCYLLKEACDKFMRAVDLALAAGYAVKIFDAFRPQEAQEKLWEICPNPMYVAPPTRGSNHTRAIAVDLTLVDLKTGKDLDMGTPFDDFTTDSHHGAITISVEAQKNRFILMGIMTAAGWDWYTSEWWHYQLFNALSYPLRSDAELPESMMPEESFAVCSLTNKAKNA
jgi:D-alanyl-D-alanine dipeptidase